MNRYVTLLSLSMAVDVAFLTHPQSSVFVIALLNTSPNPQTVDVLMSDAFIDQVCLPVQCFMLSLQCSPEDSLQGSVAAAQPWNIFDLWQKDSCGRWGKLQGTVKGKIADVHIGPHQTKVWRAEIPDNGAKRNEL